MFFMKVLSFVLLSLSTARSTQPNLDFKHPPYSKLLSSRGVPNEPTGVKKLITPQNVTIRYKEPGICETTPGVKHYAGYIDLDANTHTFFWFFEARKKPDEAPITLWLNGGPGSDSLIGLFEELGPCNVTENLTTILNPYSWSEESNLLFLSQPIGTGFSYSSEGEGTFSDDTGEYQDPSIAGVDGRYPVYDARALDTTDLCAVAAWHILQGFAGGLAQLDGVVKSREFHFWTESYGGHWGPAFYNYIEHQNQLISNGSITGIPLDFVTLGIGNGLIDELIQMPYYPEFAVHNTYGIKAINDTVYNYMKFAYNMKNGCRDQILDCNSLNLTSHSDIANNAICSQAQDMCRDNVEKPYYLYSGRGTYDIRIPRNVDEPADNFPDFLNLASTQEALGVDLNYTAIGITNYAAYFAFQTTGDFVYRTFLEDLDELLSNGVRVHLFYGDADYICNWFGGEAISLAVNYTHSKEFAAAGYTPFIVGPENTTYGAVRQYGNFSFLRMYDSGHLVPYYQPVAALEMFRRTIFGLDIATGEVAFGANYSTSGTANSTHTESAPPLPTATSSSSSTSAMASMTPAPLHGK